MQKKLFMLQEGDMEVLLVIYQISEEPKRVLWLIRHSILAASASLEQY